MDELLHALSKYPNGTYVKIEWDSALLSLGGVIETIYQTDNGMPETASMYREYYAAAFRIKHILKNGSGQTYTSNMVMEISMLAAPSRVFLENDPLIWEGEPQAS